MTWGKTDTEFCYLGVVATNRERVRQKKLFLEYIPNWLWQENILHWIVGQILRPLRLTNRFWPRFSDIRWFVFVCLSSRFLPLFRLIHHLMRWQKYFPSISKSPPPSMCSIVAWMLLDLLSILGSVVAVWHLILLSATPHFWSSQIFYSSTDSFVIFSTYKKRYQNIVSS